MVERVRRMTDGAVSRHTRMLRGCLGLLVAVGLIMVAAGCEIQKPVLPTFTTTVTIPIGEEMIDVAELIEDEGYLQTGADSCLAFFVDGEADTIRLDFDFSADFEAEDFTAELGHFDLTVADPASFGFVLGDLYAGAQLLDGQTVPVPPFDFELPSDPYEFDRIESATLSGGQLAVTLTNGLPVAVSGPSTPAQVSIDLLDAASGAVITTVTYAEAIPPGAEATVTADLAGKVLPGDVAVNLRGGSNGSASPVLIDAGARLDVEARLENIRVSEALAVVEPQQFSSDFETEMPDSIQIIEAEIVSGQISYMVRNELPLPCQASLTWNEILDGSARPLVTVVDLPAGREEMRMLDLAGHAVRSPDGQPLRALHVTMDGEIAGSDGQIVALDAADGLHGQTQPVSLELGAITGSVPARRFDIDPMTEQIELPDELSGVSLTEASLVLSVVNGTGMPAELDLVLTGTANDGERVTMTVSADIAPAVDRSATETVIVLDELNSDIVSFLNNMPTRIELGGQVMVGGLGVVGSVRPGDEAVVSWRIEAPLAVVIEHSVHTTDPNALDIDEDGRESIDDHAGRAEIVTEVTNHLPCAVSFRILLGQDPETMAGAPLLAIGPVHVDAGEVDPVTGTVSAPRISRPLLQLAAAETRIFGLPDIHTLVEVTLPGTDGQTVRVRPSDYIQVTGALSLEVTVSDED